MAPMRCARRRASGSVRTAPVTWDNRKEGGSGLPPRMHLRFLSYLDRGCFRAPAFVRPREDFHLPFRAHAGRTKMAACRGPAQSSAARVSALRRGVAHFTAAKVEDPHAVWPVGKGGEAALALGTRVPRHLRRAAWGASRRSTRASRLHSAWVASGWSIPRGGRQTRGLLLDSTQLGRRAPLA